MIKSSNLKLDCLSGLKCTIYSRMDFIIRIYFFGFIHQLHNENNHENVHNNHQDKNLKNYHKNIDDK
jgi:hypothetical protein